MHVQLFVGLLEKLVGPEVASRFSPPGIQHASDLPQHLHEAGFKDVTSTPYSHPLVFAWDDLVTFLLGPHGQFGAMLDKLEVSGRTGIHQVAQQVTLVHVAVSLLYCLHLPILNVHCCVNT